MRARTVRHIAAGACPSFPKSKPPSAAWPACSRAGASTRVEPRRADLRRAFPLDLGQRLTGATVTGLGRRAKYGLIDTDRGDTMVFHLGMSGRWRIDPGRARQARSSADRDRRRAAPGAQRSAPLRLGRPGRHRRARRVAAVRGARARAARPRSTATGSSDASQGRTAAVKLLLLDQRIVAGLGNIYVCEALYRAGIDPRARGRVDVAGQARAAGRRDPGRCSTRRSRPAARALRDFASPDGELGYFSKQLRRLRPRRRAVRGAAARSGESSRAAARPSTARAASAELHVSVDPNRPCR